MPLRRAINLVLLFFALLLAVLAAVSLRWSHLHDGAILLYIGMLIERFGMVPYRDIFDINLPGTHLLYAAIGRVFGYSDLGFRLADLSCLALLLILTWSWMRALDRRAALAGPLVFALAYLGGGEVASLQRDFIILIPVAGALALLAAPGARPGWAARAWLCGLGFGLAAMVKPHACIGLLPVLIFMIKQRLGSDGCLARQAAPDEGGVKPPHSKAFIFLFFGILIPPAIMMGWIAARGALGDFLDLGLHYWPLYGAMTGGHFPVRGLDRLTYLGEEFQKLGGLGPWVLPAALGLAFFLMQPALPVARRRMAALLAGMAAVYAIYPVLTGQFWSYHWLPLQYFLAQAGALCLAEPVLESPGAARRVLPLIYLPLTIALLWMQPAMQPWSNFKYRPPDNPTRAALIGDFLKSRLRPGDTVQVLDWCAGGTHGALRAGARPATRFVYDFPFYHDVFSPVIQGLRARLMRELERARPRFIVQTIGDRPYPQGKDASTRFEALEAFIHASYHVAWQGPGFVIYEHKF